MYTNLNRFLAAACLVAAIPAARAQENAANGAQRITPLAAARRIVDEGARGAVSRKQPRPFSGEIERPLGGAIAKQGEPAAIGARRSADAALQNGGMVTIRNSRRADLKSVETSAREGVNSRAAVARNMTNFVAQWAELTAPNYGDTLAPQQTFAWTPGSGVQDYYIWLGSCYDCADILDENEGLSLNRTINLPTDGRRLYMTLFSWINGQWYWVDYQFNAASSAGVPATLASPANGATLDSTQTFTWNAGYNVGQYYLFIGSCENCSDILNEDQGSRLSRTVNLPVDGRTIYVDLFSNINGQWFYWEYQFHAGAGRAVRAFIDNKLGYPLNVYINGNAAGSVSPYSKQYADAVVTSMTVSFELVRPTLNGNPLGDTMAGYFARIDNASGDYTFEVTNIIGGDFYMLPEISNRTALGLEIEANGGLQAENKCNCDAPAFTENVATGYYHEYSNSNIRLFRSGSNYAGPYLFFGQDGNGTMSAGGPLYKYVEADSGVVHLIATTIP